MSGQKPLQGYAALAALDPDVARERERQAQAAGKTAPKKMTAQAKKGPGSAPPPATSAKKTVPVASTSAPKKTSAPPKAGSSSQSQTSALYLFN